MDRVCYLGKPTYIYKNNGICIGCNIPTKYTYIVTNVSCKSCNESFNKYAGCECIFHVYSICIKCHEKTLHKFQKSIISHNNVIQASYHS